MPTERHPAAQGRVRGFREIAGPTRNTRTWEAKALECLYALGELPPDDLAREDYRCAARVYALLEGSAATTGSRSGDVRRALSFKPHWNGQEEAQRNAKAALHALNMEIGAVEASWQGVYEGGSLMAGGPLGTLTHYMVPVDKLDALIQAALEVVE